MPKPARRAAKPLDEVLRRLAALEKKVGAPAPKAATAAHFLIG